MDGECWSDVANVANCDRVYETTMRQLFRIYLSNRLSVSVWPRLANFSIPFCKKQHSTLVCSALSVSHCRNNGAQRQAFVACAVSDNPAANGSRAGDSSLSAIHLPVDFTVPIKCPTPELQSKHPSATAITVTTYDASTVVANLAGATSHSLASTDSGDRDCDLNTTAPDYASERRLTDQPTALHGSSSQRGLSASRWLNYDAIT